MCWQLNLHKHNSTIRKVKIELRTLHDAEEIIVLIRTSSYNFCCAIKLA